MEERTRGGEEEGRREVGEEETQGRGGDEKKDCQCTAK